jgi:autotransporter-associated beta strand protein
MALLCRRFFAQSPLKIVPRSTRWPALLLAILSLSAGAVRAQTVWTGASDTNFLNAADWSNGLPNSTTDAIINSTGNNTVELSSGSATTQNLTVGLNAGSGASLSILAGGTLTSNLGMIATAASGAPNGAVDVTGAGAIWDIISPTANALVVGVNSTAGSAQGTLTIDNGGLVSVASSTVLLAGSGNVAGVIALNGTGGNSGVLLTSQISVGSGTGGGDLDFNGGMLEASASQSDFLANFSTGEVNVESGGGIINNNGFAIGISANISGAGALTIQGAGTVTLSGTNSYAGGTTLNSGTLIVSSDAALGATGEPLTINGGVFTSNASVTVDRPVSGTGGQIAATNFSLIMGTQVANGFNFTGCVSAGASNSLTVVSNSLATIGNVTLAANAQLVSINGLALASSSDQVQTPTNANSTISGNFDLNGGNIAGPTASADTLNIEGTLSGGGTIHGNVLAFGVDPDGPTTQEWFPSSPTAHPTQQFEDVTLNIANTTSYDQEIVQGGRILFNPNGGATLTINLLDDFTPVAGDSFTLFMATGGILASSDFDNFDFPDISSDNLAWNWVNTTGTLSVMAVVPEPSTYALIFGASMVGLPLLRRRAWEKQLA